MVNTINIQFPLLEALQAQKHVTVNETLRKLDALLFLTVISRTVTTPPSAPNEGEAWIVPASGATGVWSAQGGRIATWQDGAWFYLVPKSGWRAWVSGESRTVHYSGTAWQDSLGNITVSALSFTSSASTSATAGSRTLPSAPAGFASIVVGGVTYKIPLYNI